MCGDIMHNVLEFLRLRNSQQFVLLLELENQLMHLESVLKYNQLSPMQLLQPGVVQQRKSLSVELSLIQLHVDQPNRVPVLGQPVRMPKI